MRCCHAPCGARLIDYHANISNKLLLDIRKHIKKYYSVSIVLLQWGGGCS
jgi:DNA polymerase alpha subunit A